MTPSGASRAERKLGDGTGVGKQRARNFGKLLGLAGTLSLSVLIAGCADSLPSLPKMSQLNPFAEKQQPLPGRRRSVLQLNEKKQPDLAAADKPIVLPAPVVNDDWSQPGGVANNAPGHLVLNTSLSKSWSADAGTGSSKAGRITATPLVYGGRVFTLDAASQVSAFSASGGSASWRVSLVPDSERNAGTSFMSSLTFSSSARGGFGGGLAAENGRLFAVSGFGRVAALDPATGKTLWEKNLGTPVRAAPTASGDKVFVISMEGRFYCLNALDGSENWVVRGLPQNSSLVMNVSPAVEGDLVAVPYPSGDLLALRVTDGSARWSENLSRLRATSKLAALKDAATPAIADGVVYAVGHSGRMVATKSATGERLWTINLPGTQRPWVAGGSVFAVDTTGRLMAIDRNTGQTQWTVNLAGSKHWSGPTLAGGLLWLASGKGQLVGVDAATGRVVSQKDVGGSVYIPPVVAQGRMYVMRDDATLVSLN
ncbi:MAG: PQQ-binding-like beta-propeller repeat protein [Alphaproteobacteria bacterium]|nr:PQQ-binding-like beta-propeller repeat protein [Alphaproteobacteria bacterium]